MPNNAHIPELAAQRSAIPSGSFVTTWKQSLTEIRLHHTHMNLTEMSEICRELSSSRAAILSIFNNMVPIHQLPTEVMIKIFYYVPRPSLSRSTVIWEPGIFKVEDMMLLSEVCRLWKNILFNAGILWSSLNRVACPPRFLDLAQGASLRIQLQRRGLDPDLSPFRRILVSNITRVQELHIINRIPHRFKLYLDHELPYAPQLEVLSLMGSAESPEFFEFTIPELRTLFLCRCPGLPTHPLPQLTHLYLSH